MATKAQSKASVKFNRTRDSITIRPDKETGAMIRVAASASGQSVTDFILTAISAYLQQKKAPGD